MNAAEFIAMLKEAKLQEILEIAALLRPYVEPYYFLTAPTPPTPPHDPQPPQYVAPIEPWKITC